MIAVRDDLIVHTDLAGRCEGCKPSEEGHRRRRVVLVINVTPGG